MIIEKWFSTPIMYHFLENEQLHNVQQEIEKVLPDIRQMNLKNLWGDGVKTSFKFDEPENNIFKKYNFKHLPNIINELSNQFLIQYGDKNSHLYSIDESWINFSNRNDFQFEHSHHNLNAQVKNILSGVYYYQTSGDDGDIQFVSSNSIQASGLTIFGDQYVKYKPKIGKIIMFPSWLRHRVDMNKTDSERISISFNIGK